MAVVPPLAPAQLQFHGPLPVTDEAVPAEQRPVVGALVSVWPFAVPQAPFTSRLAEQLASVPPLLPLQLHVQGPEPLIAVAVPAEQRFAVGALRKF